MGKKTIRNWVRVDCEVCNGSGVIEVVRILPNGDMVRKYHECEECMGGGKVNKATIGRTILPCVKSQYVGKNG